MQVATAPLLTPSRVSNEAFQSGSPANGRPEHYEAGWGSPDTRADCLSRGLGKQVPCPFVSCRHHLFAEVTAAGELVEHSSVPPEEMAETCVLAVADRPEHRRATLVEVGRLLRVSKSTVENIERRALAKLLAAAEEPGLAPVEQPDDTAHWAPLAPQEVSEIVSSVCASHRASELRRHGWTRTRRGTWRRRGDRTAVTLTEAWAAHCRDNPRQTRGC